jgi:hypothetical protein
MSEKKDEKRPVDIIREMNPDVWIPTGEELAEEMRKKYQDVKKEEKDERN